MDQMLDALKQARTIRSRLQGSGITAHQAYPRVLTRMTSLFPTIPPGKLREIVTLAFA